MTRLIGAFALLSGPAVLPTFVLVRGRLDAALFAVPVVGSLLAAAAGMLTLIVAGTPIGWYIVLAALANLAAAGSFVTRRSRQPRRPERPVTVPWREAAAAVTTVVVLLTAMSWPLRALERYSLAWDARSIWLLRARLFFRGHEHILAALDNKALEFSHRDYPPLLSSTVSVAWSLPGHPDYRLAQILIALLNAAVVGLLGCAIARCAPRRCRSIGLIAAVGVALAAFELAGPYATNGYADLFAAAAAAAAVMWGLVLPRDRVAFTLSVLSAWAAGLTKEEGLVAAVVVLGLIAIRYVRPRPGRPLWRRRGLAAAILAAPILAWPTAVLLLGGRLGPDVATPSDDSLVLRATVAAAEMATHLRGVLPLAAVVALVAGVVGGRHLAGRRRALHLAGDGWLWLALAGWLVPLFVIYVSGSLGIRFWLRTSVDRTTIFPRLLLTADIAVWAIVAVSRSRPPPVPRPDRS